MTSEKLFEKYSINETHNIWNDQIDNWMSVEIYRIMHGNLPPQGDLSVDWVMEFLDKQEDMTWWVSNVMHRKDWGSLYLTAKRMIYRFVEHNIIKCEDHE